MQTNILIPTYNSFDTIPSTITSLSQQTINNFKLIIHDNSDYTIFEHPTIRRLITLLDKVEIKTLVHRDTRPMNHSRARYEAFQLIDADCTQVIYIDDDVILTPKTLSRLLQTKTKHKSKPFIQGVLYDSDNVRGLHDYEECVLTSYNYKKYNPRIYQYWRWDEDLILDLQDGSRLNTGLVLIDRKMMEAVGPFNWHKHVPLCEDNTLGILLEQKYGNGLLRTGALGYHIPAGGKRKSANYASIDKLMYNFFYKEKWL